MLVVVGVKTYLVVKNDEILPSKVLLYLRITLAVWPVATLLKLHIDRICLVRIEGTIDVHVLF